MAAKEAHHFVPRFYRKNFLIMVIVRRSNYITTAFPALSCKRLKDQATERFFYKYNDVVEDELGKLERAVALLFDDP